MSLPTTKAQLTPTACDFFYYFSLYDARTGHSCRRSWLQVVVSCMPKWTATCSRQGRQDKGRLRSQLRMESEVEVLGDTLAAIHAWIAARNSCVQSGMRPVPDTLAVIAALIHAANYLLMSLPELGSIQIYCI